MGWNKLSWRIGLGLFAATLLATQWGCRTETTPVEAPEETTPAEPSEETTPADPATAPPAVVGTLQETPVELDVPLGLPPVLVPEDNPVTEEKIALGKMLYFDKRLSRDGTISCATCHDPEVAWTENRATSEGIGGQIGGANSPTVINSAYATAQFWDGRAASLEEQALGPIENPIEMGHKLDELVVQLQKIPEYQEAFGKAFGTPVTKDGIGKAIASFERTVLSGDSPYDRHQDGKQDALTEAQKRGLDVFERVGCDTCHKPPVFSNFRYYNAGVGMDKDPPDQGRKSVTEKERDLGKFRVAPLREVANTGPYFHDGSVATLEEAVALMVAGGKDNENLSGMLKSLRDEEVTEEDQQDLVEFLKSLSGKFPGKDG